ncbi:MAG TPA: hypothetical protein VFT55_04015 [Planctomycetota bacterium]|nr:hypothetical protein [Planctomycetota bacterium]
MTAPVEQARPGCHRRDVAIALLLGIATAALYATTRLGRIYGNDGAWLADWFAFPERPRYHYHNFLYLPAASCLQAVLPAGLLAPADDPLAALEVLSQLCGAIGTALTYLCCRRLGAGHWASIAGTGLLAVSPVLWFFSSAIELHTLHFAVVAACAWTTLMAPWRRPVLATMLTASVFWLPYLTHQSAPVLGPGWVILVQCARARSAAAFRLFELFLVGVALLLSLIFGLLLNNWLRGLGFALNLDTLVTTVGGWRREFTPSIVWEAFLGPLFLLVPATIAALCLRRVDHWLRWCGAALLVPAVGCVLWWGIAERGGYLLGQSWVMAVLVSALASQLPRRVAIAGMLVLIAAQAWAGFRFVRDFDREGFQIAERVDRVREHLGDTGLLVSSNDNAPDMKMYLPGVEELNARGTLSLVEIPLTAWFSEAYAFLQARVGGGKFLFDVSYQLRNDLPPRMSESASMLEEAIRRDYRVTEFAHPSWPMWLVEPRN